MSTCGRPVRDQPTDAPLLALMRPMLRPGTHVLDRGEGEVQVGLDPHSALVLPGTPAVRGSLRLLTASAQLGTYDEAATLRLLEGHGALIDERDLMPLLGDDDISPHTTAALARAVGPAAADARRARRERRTHIRSFGPDGADALRDSFVGLARAAGLGVPAAPACPTAACWSASASRTASCSTAGCATGSPHLLVRLTEGRAVVGPFVVPGATACLRCLDAHCTDADPSWPLLVRQYATASSRRPRRRRPRAGGPAARGAGAGLGRPRPRVVRRRAAAVHVVGDAHHPPVAEQPRDPAVAAPPGLRVQLGVSRSTVRRKLYEAVAPVQWASSDTMGP